MQVHVRGTALVLAVLLGAGYALTPAFATSAPQDAAGVVRPQHSALSDAMANMSDAKRAIRDALEAGDGAAALAALTGFQTHIVAAKAEAPPRAAKMSAAEKAEFVAGFRSALSNLLRVTCDLELALLEGRLDEATALLREKLGALEDAGHERFGGEDEH